MNERAIGRGAPGFSLLLGLLVSGLTWDPASLSAADGTFERPNVVLILADDLSWRDLGVTGNPWHDTPHLDRLAAQGRRFTQAYAAAPICSASRVALLTGRSPARLGFEFVTKPAGTPLVDGQPWVSPSYPTDLPRVEMTLGELFSEAGYRTGYFGKWHVSQHNGGYLNWSDTHGPRQQGFHAGDQEFGSHPYGDSGRSAAEMQPFAEGDYGSDALTEKTIAFLRETKAARTPFFLMLSHYYVHTPIRSRARWLVDKYRQRLPRDAGEARAVYGAMVETLDHLVGLVLHELDALGLSENTLVVFTSDNGGDPRFASNGPARGSKWNLYDGGIRVPFVVRWPGKVVPGSVDPGPIIGTDLFPTFADLLAQETDKSRPLDGISLLNQWQGGPALARAEPLVWHFPFYHPETDFDEALPEIGINDPSVNQTRPHSAIRVGDYKLVHFYETNRSELYDLSTDPGELYDLSQRLPEQTRALQMQLTGYFRRVGARLPQPRSASPLGSP